MAPNSASIWARWTRACRTVDGRLPYPASQVPHHSATVILASFGLTYDTRCHLWGHDGAGSVDHLVPIRDRQTSPGTSATCGQPTASPHAAPSAATTGPDATASVSPATTAGARRRQRSSGSGSSESLLHPASHPDRAHPGGQDPHGPYPSPQASSGTAPGRPSTSAAARFSTSSAPNPVGPIGGGAGTSLESESREILAYIAVDNVRTSLPICWPTYRHTTH